ncbi:MAG: SEL1-like repeat protein [Magnetococcales bacterium]|nr:SEL1-like repeat protein [Magnetococcales bacterium]
MKRYSWLLFALLLGAGNPELDLKEASRLIEGTPEERVQGVQLYETLARQGIAKAQTEYGRKLYYGEDIKEDIQEGLLWFHKAAEQGDGQAMFFISRAYYKGRGTAQDNSLYLHWLRKGAEAGHTTSREFLGRELMEGKLLPADNKEALFWFKKAADSGVERLRRMYAVHLLTGDLGEQNIPFAVAELEDLMASGSEKARWILAERALHGLFGSPKDPQRAIELAMPLAEAGDSSACRIVGQAYASPPLLLKEANQQKAIYWLTRPGEKMTDRARALMLENALLFNLNDPVEGLKQIRHWFGEITNREVADEKLFQIIRSFFASNHPAFITFAISLLADLMVDGYPEGLLLRSELAMEGLAVNVSPWQVASGYLQAAPHLAEAHEHARLLIQGDWDRIFAGQPVEPWRRPSTRKENAQPLLADEKSLRIAAGKGGTLAMWQLALRGIDAEGKPSPEARSWMKRAAEGGLVAAQIFLGWEMDHDESRNGGPAHDWLVKAARSGSDFGRYRLAIHLLRSSKGPEVGVGEAISLLKALADKELNAARLMLVNVLGSTRESDHLRHLEPLLRPLAQSGSHSAGYLLAVLLLTDSPATAAHLAEARQMLAQMEKQELTINPVLQAIAADLTPEGTPLAEEAGEEVVRRLMEISPDSAPGSLFSEVGSQFLQPNRHALHRLGLVWQKRAARQGDGAAMKRLGHMYLLGYIVEVDTEAARQWYEQAAATGDEEAGQLAARLARREIDAARERVPLEACWYSKTPDKYWLEWDQTRNFTKP